MLDYKDFDDLVLRDSKHTEDKPLVTEEEATWLRETPQLHYWVESLQRRMNDGKAHIESRKRKIERLEQRAELELQEYEPDSADALAAQEELDREREATLKQNRSTERFISGLNDRYIEATLLVRQRSAPIDAATVMVSLVSIRGLIDPIDENTDVSKILAALDDMAEEIDSLIDQMGE